MNPCLFDSWLLLNYKNYILTCLDISSSHCYVQCLYLLLFDIHLVLYASVGMICKRPL